GPRIRLRPCADRVPPELRSVRPLDNIGLKAEDLPFDNRDSGGFQHFDGELATRVTANRSRIGGDFAVVLRETKVDGSDVVVRKEVFADGESKRQPYFAGDLVECHGSRSSLVRPRSGVNLETHRTRRSGPK